MSRALALLRPEPGWSASAKLASSQGFEVVGHPIFEAEPLAWTLPDGEFDALLIGSAAVFRTGGEGLRRLAHLPVYAVGDATADAARASGFAVARTGRGGLQGLLDERPGETRRFLRIGGEERVDLHPHPGQFIVDVAAYRMRPLALEREFSDRLRQGGVVAALHSAAAARHFALEIGRDGIARTAIDIVALGPRIAAAAGGGWRSLHVADRPTDAALLAKAAPLCK